MQFKRIKGDLFQQKGGIKVIPINGDYNFKLDNQTHTERTNGSVLDAFFAKYNKKEHCSDISATGEIVYDYIEHIIENELYDSKQISLVVETYKIGHFSFIKIEEEIYCFLVSSQIYNKYDGKNIRKGEDLKVSSEYSDPYIAVIDLLDFLKDHRQCYTRIHGNRAQVDFITKHFPNNTPIDLYLPIIGTLNAPSGQPIEQFIEHVKNMVLPEKVKFENINGKVSQRSFTKEEYEECEKQETHRHINVTVVEFSK